LGILFSSMLCTCPNCHICAWHPKISKDMQLWPPKHFDCWPVH
jgi:hypothetical protein